MKKIGILNRDISRIVAETGHYDGVVVCDAGFPIPKGVPCIDLSLHFGSPTVLEVLRELAVELPVELFYYASEILDVEPNREAQVREIFPDAQPVTMSHAEFKHLAAKANAVIRTGDTLSYSNVLVVTGVTY